MPTAPDPQRVASFLMAAWKGLVGLEEAVEGLHGQESEAARKALARRSRELSDSASTYGFHDLSRLAASMVRLANAFPPSDHSSSPDVLQLLGDTLTVLPMVLDNIAAEASEDIPQIPGLQWRYDVEAPAAEELAVQRMRAQAPGAVDTELTRLRREDPEMMSFFVAEIREHLVGMVARLNELRSIEIGTAVIAPEALNDFFRHAHTIKGAAYTVGCLSVGDLAHGLEEIWVAVRHGDRSLTPDILQASHQSAALLEKIADRLDGRANPFAQNPYQDLIDLLDGLRRLAPKDDETSSREITPAARLNPTPSDLAPSAASVSATNQPPLPSLPTLTQVEHSQVPVSSASTSPGLLEPGLLEPGLPKPRPSDPLVTDPTANSDDSAPSSSWAAPPVSVPAVSFAAEEPPEVINSRAARSTLRVDLQRLENVLDLAGEVTVAHGTSVKQLGHLESIHQQLDDCKRRMTQTVDVFQERHLNPALEIPKLDAPFTHSSDRSGQSSEEQASEEQAGPDPERALSQRTVAEQFAELEFDRYDDFNVLARRIGELSSDLTEIHRELEQMLSSARRSSLQVQNLTRRLRVGIGKVRMVPVGRLFARFSRLARNSANEAGKELEIELEGEQVEIDNAVIERVVEPLTHLVQNAIHHGIEAPDTRRLAGKDSRGILRFSAQAKGRRVRLEVSDDGAGIDANILKHRAVELGFKTAAQVEAMSDADALHLVYIPGLTTTSQVTTAAGRGVGMDAVRHSVHRLGGDLHVYSELGVGTRFTLELPVSLLVTEALVVRVGESAFALPLPQVDQLGHLFEHNLRTLETADETSEAGEIALLADRQWPVLRLADRLGLTALGPVDEVPDLLAVAALVRAPTPTALIVDEVLGIEELVVKPLGPFLEAAQYFSGATLDTRGQIILMLDLASLISGEHSSSIRPQASPVALPEAPPRVLLVDDSLSVRRVLDRVLQKQGYEVFTASDGAEALELLLDLPFDAVITDLEMPRMSGYELIDDLRNRASTRETPVWVITTRAGARHAELARELGAVGYLAKPVDADLLIGQLDSVVRRRRSQR